ncbi:peroxiredoxin [Acuticoccus sp. M5D2P5]|uniref:peroxiredoxin n=1 Tax=Acuticoccus kalidii TaxID=2910977 RepID=UPI001F2FBC96|nr:peroxiredoxin [Acuticoccus kalidii]MCF3931889.1 peroxiredoxin [Acuticoccus kalidii]
MTIAVGDKLPTATFKVMTADGPSEVTIEELTKGRKVILFGVPGAFTPTCDRNHLPGFIENLDAIKAKGVDEVCVVSVNDMFVMNAWAKASGGEGKITFLADGSALFTRAIGLELDASGFGMGVRSKRYSMLVEDGVVKILNIEETPGEAKVSGATAILEAV